MTKFLSDWWYYEVWKWHVLGMWQTWVIFIFVAGALWIGILDGPKDRNK